MDVWTLNEKLKKVEKDLDLSSKRLDNIESFLSKLNSKLDSINKASNEAVQNKKAKPSSVRTKRSTTKKSKGS